MLVKKERRKGKRKENMKRCPEVNQIITKLPNFEKHKTNEETYSPNCLNLFH